MKTAISIPDKVFKEAERLARQLKSSRSRLYSRALAEFLARHSPDRVTDAMNRVVGAVEPEAKGFQRAAARRVFTRVEW